MKQLKLAITERARKYGYVTWPKKLDSEIRGLLKDCALVCVTLDGQDLGEKRVDWKYRRISLGPRRTQGLDRATTTWTLNYSKEGVLRVSSGG